MNNYLQQFAENGHRVFLVNSIERNFGKPTCGCGNPKCTAIGKHPVSENWQRTPEWDEDQIDNMQMVADTGRGYGVMCSNLLVIDVDARNGGVNSYDTMIDKFPEISGCGLIVETGSGGGSRHLYFKLSSDVSIRQTHPDFTGVDFKHKGFVIGPGSPHISGKDYKILSGSIDDIDDAPEALVAFLKREEVTRVEYDGGHIDVSESVLRGMLDKIDEVDEYQSWVSVGMALHHATHGEGIELWHEWSRRGSKYEAEALDIRWHGFGKSTNPVTIGTLIKLAKDNGWVEPVTINGENEPELQGWFAKALTGNPITESVTAEAIKESKNPIKRCPVDVSKIDLTKPPGFVGEVTEWINSQCMYPRRSLAAMAALFAVGNAAGLRHMENSSSQTRTNLAIFCVAASGTGKDAVLSAVRKIHYIAGLGQATHGSIKSDREMYQNLIHHQAAIYTIDEVGGRLAKIANSRKGGAVHLDGVMETFMDVFTKSNDSILLSGDTKKEVDKFLRERYSELKRMIEENEDKDGRAAREIVSIQKRLAMDGKVDNPFLSMIGFTTPRQFSNMMTIDNVETGFLGRTIMCVEPDINPYPNADFVKKPMPSQMEMRLMQIAFGGSSGNGFGRVENIGEVDAVGHTDAAKKLLDECFYWSWSFTQGQIETKGESFSALYRRLFEKVVKIALVLGVADGEIDVEHVQWAVAASLRDIEEKVSAVTIEDQSFSPQARLMETVSRAVKSKEGQTLNYLHGRSNLRKYRKEDVESALKSMIERGSIRQEEGADGRSGEPLMRYYTA